MKPFLFFMLLAFGVATCGAVSPADAPYITAQSNKLTKKIAADVAAGKLTKDDGDKFTARISHVQNVVETEQKLTNTMRQTLRNELARIAKDIDEKEGTPATTGDPAPAGFFGSPAATPAPSP